MNLDIERNIQYSEPLTEKDFQDGKSNILLLLDKISQRNNHAGLLTEFFAEQVLLKTASIRTTPDSRNIGFNYLVGGRVNLYPSCFFRLRGSTKEDELALLISEVNVTSEQGDYALLTPNYAKFHKKTLSIATSYVFLNSPVFIDFGDNRFCSAEYDIWLLTKLIPSFMTRLTPVYQFGKSPSIN